MNNQEAPETIPIISYILVILLAGWGGIVRYLKRLRDTPQTSFTFAELLGEMVISGFVGVIIFLLCEASAVNRVLSAAFAGMAGHMGSQVVYMLEVYLAKKFFKSEIEIRVER